MQNPESQQHRCPKCHALPGNPCVTLYGREAERVHYGRPQPSPVQLRAYGRIRETMASSSLRPTVENTGIWFGSEYIGKGEGVPYGAWQCPCGESMTAIGDFEVRTMNALYAEHGHCRV